MPKESRIQLVEERLTKIEQAVINDIPHRLAMHDKFIYMILAFLLMILGTLIVGMLGK